MSPRSDSSLTDDRRRAPPAGAPCPAAVSVGGGSRYLLQCGARGHAAQLLPQLLELLHGDPGGRGRGAEAGGAAGSHRGCQLGSLPRILL